MVELLVTPRVWRLDARSLRACEAVENESDALRLPCSRWRASSRTSSDVEGGRIAMSSRHDMTHPKIDLASVES